eukprot:SAG11_NODE_3112_length_2678_cov_2.781698_5_plen_90_part_00
MLLLYIVLVSFESVCLVVRSVMWWLWWALLAVLGVGLVLFFTVKVEGDLTSYNIGKLLLKMQLRKHRTATAREVRASRRPPFIHAHPVT